MLRFEHHLATSDNFESWELWIMMLLKEKKLESLVKEEKEEPKDDPKKTLWIEYNEKAMKIIVDIVWIHVVPIVAKHVTTYHMFKALEKISIVNNTSRNLTLRRQIVMSPLHLCLVVT